MKKGDLSPLNQLINSLKESELKLEESYKKKDLEKFNEIKKFMLKIHKEISRIIK